MTDLMKATPETTPFRGQPGAKYQALPPKDFDTTPRDHFPATEMRCSVCGTPLVPAGMFRCEDACSGVYTDFKYTCPNHPLIFFGFDGEIFFTPRSPETFEADYNEYSQYQYINGLRSAFGSFARKIEVEIYKQDEKKFYPLTNRWTLVVYYEYKSNENGDILQRKRHFRFLKDHFYHTFAITILYQSFRDVHKGVWQHFFHNIVSRPAEKSFMLNWFGIRILNRRWPYRFHQWYGRVWMRVLGYGPGWEELK
ncbi:MAG: hypothetical protein WC551_11680 [Patescibacteria group bacterium]